MARVRLLARQSLTKADSVSVDAQIAGMTDAFTAQGHTIVGAPMTAQNTRGWREIADRADLTEAIASADRGEYDILGVWSIDRLARSVRILETVVHELDQHGVTFLSHAEPWAADPFMRQIGGAMAEKFTRDLRAKMRSVWPHHHRLGKHHGIPPYGFTKHESKLVVADDGESATLRRMIETMLNGGTVRGIVTDLNREGIAPRRADAWREEIVRVILRNPANAGGVRLNGAVVWDAHPGIISRAEWERLQARIGTEHTPRAHKLATSYLDGLVEHGCGARAYILLYRPHGREVRMIACRTSHMPAASRCDLLPRGASARKIEAAVPLALAHDLKNTVPVDTAIGHAERLATSDLSVKRREHIESRRHRIVERRQRAEGLYLDGRRDSAWWVAEEAEAVAALTVLDAELTALPAPPERAGYAAIGEQIAQMAPLINAMAPARIRSLLMDAGIVVVDGLEVTIKYTPAWQRFIPRPCRVPWRTVRY